MTLSLTVVVMVHTWPEIETPVPFVIVVVGMAPRIPAPTFEAPTGFWLPGGNCAAVRSGRPGRFRAPKPSATQS